MKLKSLFKLLRNSKIKTFKKGEMLIAQGDIQKDIFYVTKGLVRSFMVTDYGEEITFQLFAENQLFGNAHAILFHEPSNFFYEALEKTKVYSSNLQLFQNLTATHPDLLNFGNTTLGSQILKRAFQRLDSFVFLSPEERYIKYCKNYPNIIHRVPDKYIANVLGITPVSLSRIRNRISKKGK